LSKTVSKSEQDFVVAEALVHYRAGNSRDALSALDELCLRDPLDLVLRRRMLSLSGGLMTDVGRWIEADRRLLEAKRLAFELNDEVGGMAVALNISSLRMAQWKYLEVIELTNSLKLNVGDPVDPGEEKAALLMNRAGAALAVRSGSIAMEAASSSFAWLRAQPATLNPLFFAGSGQYLVRTQLLANRHRDAEATLEVLNSLTFTGRALAHVQLANAVFQSETGDVATARAALTALLDAPGPEGLKRDALSILLRIEQQSGDVQAALGILQRMATIVVAHRTAQMRDSLDMREEAAPVVRNLVSSQGTTKNIPRIYSQIAGIIEASETSQAQHKRRAIAVLASGFAEGLGYGSQYIQAIVRGALGWDFGAFSRALHADSGISRRLFERESLKTTLRILDELGIDANQIEYRVAAHAYERANGDGPLGLSSASIATEAQIVSICRDYVLALSIDGFSEQTHMDFIKQALISPSYSRNISTSFSGWALTHWQLHLQRVHSLSEISCTLESSSNLFVPKNEGVAS
jgi:HD-GYP domain-containing protein (c-di-GMP phosphodiesterase class II)